MSRAGRSRLRLILPFAGLLFLTFVHSMQTRRYSQISEERPTPLPLADPGPDAATLQLRIVDGRTGRPVSATVSINGGEREPDEGPYLSYSLRRTNSERQGPMRFRKIDDYFFTDGSVEVRVPPGQCVVEVGKGYEYQPTRRVYQLAKQEVHQATIAVSRWIDMAQRGWYSGDTHIHFERDGSNDDQLLVLTSAKGIRYAFSLSMNTGGYALGREFESWGQALGLGPASDVRRGDYFLSSGQEYRNSSMGHVTVVMADRYVPAGGWTANANLGPSLAVIGDQARELGGYMGLNHGGYYRLEADYVGLTGKSDFLELMQLGGYRGLGLDGWYDFLNLGFRWPIVGASDFPYSRELGDSLTYVFSETEPTPRGFMEGAVQGRSFVTSGPMLLVSVNGKGPGESLHFSGGQPAGLEVQVQARSPLYPMRYLEIIWNGRVVSRYFDAKGRSVWDHAERIRVAKSGWVAVRIQGDPGTEAHSNPVYVDVGGRLPFDDDSCGQILARLEGSIRSAMTAEIRDRYRDIHAHLKRFRETRDPTGLALPPR